MPTIDLAGRELWALQEGGRLQHSVLSACAGAASATPGGPVALMPCEGADKWEPLGNGQLRAGRFCLSQSGQAAGSADVASKSAVVATSTSHPSAHGAWAAVDSDESSYWASKRDEAEPVSLTVDLGGVHALDAVTIAWEFPAKAFSVSSALKDGEPWTELFSTATNVVNSTTIVAGGRRASKIRIVMREAHPVHGVFQGHPLYGIRSLRALAPRLSPVLEDCASAGASKDARDKYFVVPAPAFDPSAAGALKSELPQLDAAKASLGGVVSEVSEVVPRLPLCQPSTAISEAASAAAPALLSLRRAHLQARRQGGSQVGAGKVGEAVARSVGLQHGVEAGSLRELLLSARAAVVRVRAALS